MNNQDYEQKRRECWEEFRKEHPEISCKSLLRNFVDSIFDRAFALGKQTETITQEDVEKASMKYRDAHYDKFYESLHDDSRTWDALEHVIIASFISGAQFALGKQEKDAEDTVIQGWVARDDGERWYERELHLFTRNKPERRKLMGDWIGRPSMMLDSSLFPDLTWESDPLEVEIILKRKKKNL